MGISGGALLVVATLNPSYAQYMTVSWVPSMEACEVARAALIREYAPQRVDWLEPAKFGITPEQVRCLSIDKDEK